MFKKVAAGLVAGMAVMMMAGCGSDLSGTYVGEPKNEGDCYINYLEVHKGDKDGYNINYHSAGYTLKAVNGEGTKVYNPIFAVGPVPKPHYVRDVTATWYSEIANQLFTSAVKDNRMTFTDSKNGGFVTGTIVVDKDGNLIDEAGKFSDKPGRKFTKVKEIDWDKVKAELQENVKKYADANYNHTDVLMESVLGKLEFKDGTDKAAKK